MNVIFLQREGIELVLICGEPENEDELTVAVILAEPEPELLAA